MSASAIRKYATSSGLCKGIASLLPRECGQVRRKQTRSWILRFLSLTLARLIEEIVNKVVKIKSFCTYASGRPFSVGDISITPYFASHSAADSHMLLIECDGKRVLHTGDLREHGFLGKGLEKTLKKHVWQVDVLITEGTMLSRDDGHTKTESEIQADMSALMAQYRNVFVLCSSTNFDRLAGLHKANARFRSRPFVCDVYQNEQFKTLPKYSGQHSDLYVIDDAAVMSLRKVNLHKRMVENGFTMVVRDNTDS